MPGDVVVIAGKGHETYQEVAGRRLPFDDAVEARQALAARYGSDPSTLGQRCGAADPDARRADLDHPPIHRTSRSAHPEV